MFERFAYYWRVVLGAFFFLVFYGGALFLAALVLPLLNILPIHLFNITQLRGAKDESLERKLRVQRVLHRAARVYLAAISCFRLAEISFKDLEKRPQGASCVIVSNHPSLLDVVLILAVFPELHLVAKQELRQSFFIGRLLSLAGYLDNSERADPHRFISNCSSVVASGRHLLIFPEGTRSERGELQKFHRSAAAIALEAESQVLPIVIRANPPPLGRGSRWFDAPREKPSIELQVFDCIDTKEVAGGCANEFIARRVLTKRLENFYQDAI